MINRGRFRLFDGVASEYSARAIALMQRATVVDMLSPLTLNAPLLAKWFANPKSMSDAEYQRYKESGINVFHIADGIGGPNAVCSSACKTRNTSAGRRTSTSSTASVNASRS